MRDARRFVFRVAPAVAVLSFICMVQPAAAQFNDTVAFTITDARGEGAVAPGCPKSPYYAVNPLRLTRGSLPPSDYSCFTGQDDVRGFAAYYAPYAIQAALSYQPISEEAALSGAIDVAFAARSERVKLLLRQRNWHFRYSDRCLTNNLCGANYSVDSKGLAYQIWSRGNPGACREAAIAFRGSVLSVNAWAANFEQYIPALASEYDQVRLVLSAILRDVQQLGCGKIVTVGHSLGGGLGQFAALSAPVDRQIAKVVTFNTSPVSGVNLIADAPLLKKNAVGLTIDRVNQQGEALSFHFFKRLRQTRATVCDPLIRGVEFNSGAGGSGWLSAFEQHEIVPFASRLVDLSYKDPNTTDLVTPKMPPAGRDACGTRYRDEPDEPMVSALPNANARQAFASGLVMGQPSGDMAVYASIPDRDVAPGKRAASARKSAPKAYVNRSGRIHMARS